MVPIPAFPTSLRIRLQDHQVVRLAAAVSRHFVDLLFRTVASQVTLGAAVVTCQAGARIVELGPLFGDNFFYNLDVVVVAFVWLIWRIPFLAFFFFTLLTGSVTFRLVSETSNCSFIKYYLFHLDLPFFADIDKPTNEFVLPFLPW